MKFTNDELSDALKAKFGKNLAMSERTLKEQAERLYKRLEKANNDDELADIVNEYYDDFESINGNVRKDKSDFAKEWEKNHKTTKTEENKQEPNKPAPNEDKLDTLLKEIQALKEERAQEKAKAAADAKKAEIRSALKTKGITDDKWIDAYLKKQTFAANTDTDAEVDEITAFYNLGKASSGGNANAGKGGGSGKEEEADFSDVAAIMKRRRGETA